MAVKRYNIGIFGKTNSGKSSLMNLIIGNECSIVDEKAGTTADTKTALFEIHGIGPVKLLDTAGMDEEGELGEKKRRKAENDLKECDLVIVVVKDGSSCFETEERIIRAAKEYDKQVIIVHNLFDEGCSGNASGPGSGFFEDHKEIRVRAIDNSERSRLLDFIVNNIECKKDKGDILPFIEKGEYYLLNIPMDEETPEGRYLRPQAMCEEHITRKFAFPISFRMDLKKAREEDESERKRYLSVLDGIKDKKVRCVITDSQAIDVIDKWTPKEHDITTFSIMMINHMSGGRLRLFAEGIKALEGLNAGDRILIAEACNHSRIKEDIGTVQIPDYIRKRCPGVIAEHNFGREFRDNNKLKEYKLIVHCGGCMIDSQKLKARLRELEGIGVPVTNYGIFLAYMQGKETLRRVLKVWGV
ncbi:GTP-binding protein [Candidatus Woesearchaeota archaeon]|nr:GTP-binding protein [Candidatus Woesearchaeota archaeon]